MKLSHTMQEDSRGDKKKKRIKELKIKGERKKQDKSRGHIKREKT